MIAATAAVSESALVYVARHRNLMISTLMIVVQAALTVAIIKAMPLLPIPPGGLQAYQAAGAALALALALALASILKARLLCRLLGAPVQGWRWSLIWAGAAAILVGFAFMALPRRFEWIQLAIGAPAILLTFGLVGLVSRLHPGGPGAVPQARREEPTPSRLGDRDAANSVPEMPHPGEDHRQPGLVRRGDHLLVADRAAGLDHRGRAGLDRGQQAVGEGEEGVRGDRRADRARLRASRLSPPRPSPSRRRCAPNSIRFIWPAPMPAVAPSLA